MADQVEQLVEFGTRELLVSYRSRVCPMCGGRKAKRRSMCSGCYGGLVPALKSACYKRFLPGYAEAIRDSADFLGVSAVYVPGGLVGPSAGRMGFGVEELGCEVRGDLGGGGDQFQPMDGSA